MLAPIFQRHAVAGGRAMGGKVRRPDGRTTLPPKSTLLPSIVNCRQAEVYRSNPGCRSQLG